MNNMLFCVALTTNVDFPTHYINLSESPVVKDEYVFTEKPPNINIAPWKMFFIDADEPLQEVKGVNNTFFYRPADGQKVFKIENPKQ